MRAKSKALSGVLTFALVASMLPVAAFASDNSKEEANDVAAVQESEVQDEQLAADNTSAAADVETDASDSDAVDTSSEDASAKANTDNKAVTQKSSKTEAKAKTVTASSARAAQVQGTHSVIVRYVNKATGEQICAANIEPVSPGKDWTITSPEVAGYELVDASKDVVTGTAGKAGQVSEYKVEYKVTKTTYSVVHMKESGDGIYLEAERETFDAEAFSTVTAKPKSYDGYECVTTNLDIKVAPKDTSITLYYNQNSKTRGVYFYTQGTYIAPVIGPEGTPVTAPADPVRQGYIFDGWDGQIPTEIGSESVHLHAKWKPATDTPYFIEYYKQNSKGGYSLAETVKATGTTDEVTPEVPKKATEKETDEYAWYEYANETSPTIDANGKTVKRVYYDYVDVTVIWQLEMDDGHFETVFEETMPFYSDLEYWTIEEFNQAYWDKGGDPNKHLRYYGLANLKVNMITMSSDPVPSTTDFDTKTATYNAYFTDKETRAFMMREYYESKNGGYTPGTTHVSLTTNTSITLNLRKDGDYAVISSYEQSTEAVTQETFDSANFKKMVVDDSTSNQLKIPLDSDSNGVKVYYDRKSFDATYLVEGKEVARESHKYGLDYNTNEANPGKAPQEGFVFSGWYDNPEFSGEPVTETKMANGGTNYYGKWIRPDVTISYDSQGGTPVDDQVLTWGDSSVEPAAPTKDSGAEFLGWFTVDEKGVPTRFEFGKPVEANVKLTALWRVTTDTVSFKIVHKDADGNVLAEEELTGTPGTSITVSALDAKDPRRKGLAFVDSPMKSFTLSADPDTNEVTFIYDVRGTNAVIYTISYIDKETGKRLAPDEVYASHDREMSASAIAVDGYKAVEDNATISADSPEYQFLYNKVEDKAPATDTPAADKPATDNSANNTNNADQVTKPASAKAKTAVKATEWLAQTADPLYMAVIGLGGGALAAVAALLLARRRMN